MDKDKSTWAGRLANGILDLVYPPGLYCISCGKITDSSRTYGLCNDCMAAMNWVTGRRCAKCGRPLTDNNPGSKCFRCSASETSGRPQAFGRGFVCTGYGAAEQALIFAFKYGGRADIGDMLGEMLCDRMLAEYEPDELAGMYDVVVPIPTHRDKKLKRGYNHAALMAEEFAKRTGLRCDPEMMIRTRATLPMKELGPEARIENIRGVFRVRSSRIRSIKGARILLVDDIFTTGATINEAATLLKESGASQVDFLVFAAAGDMIR